MAWVAGVDVSNYQGTVDWRLVARAGIHYAWAKATEGVTYVDPYLLPNLVGGAGAGLAVGAYHFARPSNGWFNEVGHFLTHAHPERWTLPPVLDLEVPHPGGRSAATEWAHNFLAWLEPRSPVTPVLYCGTFFPVNHHELTDWPLWLPAYTAPLQTNPDPTDIPQPAEPRPWSVWQYTCKGTVPGIRGECDRNVATTEWWEEVTMPTMAEIEAAIKAEGARVEKALTDEINATERRLTSLTIASRNAILDILPTARAYFDGMAKHARATCEKLGISHPHP